MAPDVDVCKICNDNFIVCTKAVKCAIYNLKFHPSCVSIKNNWMKIIPACDNLMWLCDVCKSSYLTSESDKADITVIKKEIECLKRELSSTEKLLENLDYTVTIQKSLLENNRLTPSLLTLKSGDVDPNHHSKPGTSKYSDALKKLVKNYSPVLIIKAPSEHANTKNIMDEVTTSINPGNLRVRINTSRTIKNGVAVFCHDDQSLTTLKSNLANKLGTNYTINEAKKLNPTLLIKNVNLRGLNTPQEILNDNTSLNNFEESQKMILNS
nr:unnamed protein product [Callosobruchus analis]